MKDTSPLPSHLERQLAPEWNGKEETLEALLQLV